MQTIFPILRSNDARAAIRWLCATFGFVELFSVPESGPVVRHAQLQLGTNVIMLGSARSDDSIESPQALGAATQALYVWVDNVDAHFERARKSGAIILEEPADTEYGHRRYGAADPEGHEWYFAREIRRSRSKRK